MIPKWMCVGGPLHGQWRPGGQALIPAVDPEAKTDYAVSHTGNEEGWQIRVAVASPPRPVLYHPRLMETPGWRIGIPLYIDARILGGGRLPVGLVMPGWLVSTDLDAEVACRWCFGRAMEGMEMCSRISCITNVAAIQSLDRLTGSDADWEGDRP